MYHKIAQGNIKLYILVLKYGCQIRSIDYKKFGIMVNFDFSDSYLSSSRTFQYTIDQAILSYKK